MMTLRTLLEKSSDAELLREMIGFTAQRLMELEVEGLTGAAHGERSPERMNQRNGYRDRTWETRAGTVELRIPKLRWTRLIWRNCGRVGRFRGRAGGSILPPSTMIRRYVSRRTFCSTRLKNQSKLSVRAFTKLRSSLSHSWCLGRAAPSGANGRCPASDVADANHVGNHSRHECHASHRHASRHSGSPAIEDAAVNAVSWRYDCGLFVPVIMAHTRFSR
jgi:mutator family transposase